MLDTWSGSSDQQVGVLVVGAGPVGLCHALWLRQFDVDVLVIDADARSHQEEWMVLGPDARRVLNRVGVQTALSHMRVDYDAIVLAPPRGVGDDRRETRSAKRPRLLRLQGVGDQAPLSLVNRAVLEEVLERRAIEVGVQVQHGQRLQRVDIRPTHCEARIVPTREEELGARNHPPDAPRHSTRRVLAHWVIGTDGYHSIVRRDLRAAFRPIAEPRVASIVRVAGRRSVDVEGAVQVSVGENAMHTVWSLGGEQLLWVTQTTDAEASTGIEIDPDRDGFTTSQTLSSESIHHAAVADAFLEREAKHLGIEIDEVSSKHAVRYRPSAADPLGRGRAWTSGAAAQLIAPALGLDDNLGLLEVPDLALLLGFGAEDGMAGLPTLTPRLYHERRARAQQHALGAHPLGTEWPGQHGWSSQDREVVAGAFPFLTRVAVGARAPAPSVRNVEQARG